MSAIEKAHDLRIKLEVDEVEHGHLGQQGLSVRRIVCKTTIAEHPPTASAKFDRWHKASERSQVSQIRVSTVPQQLEQTQAMHAIEATRSPPDDRKG